MIGTLYLITEPATEPVSLEQAKAHLRVDSSDEDDLIEGYLYSARDWAETFTRRALITQVWDLKLPDFGGDSMELPMPPLQSVSSISYVDTAGDSQTLSSAYYTVRTPTGPHAPHGRITLNYGYTYPSTQGVPEAVTIRFTAGYGDDEADVPATIRTAIKQYVAELYKEREQSIVGQGPVQKAPATLERLLWQFRADL